MIRDRNWQEVENYFWYFSENAMLRAQASEDYTKVFSIGSPSRYWYRIQNM